jgi:hypothetical protein
VTKRRERTRHLIELGGLVMKAGIVDLVEDDRAVMLGALLEVRSRLLSADREKALLLWSRAGRRAFETNSKVSAA